MSVPQYNYTFAMRMDLFSHQMINVGLNIELFRNLIGIKIEIDNYKLGLSCAELGTAQLQLVFACFSI